MTARANSVRGRRIGLSGIVTFTTGVLALAVMSATPASASSSAHSVSVGLPPVSIALDGSAHTAYVTVSDGVTSEVAVVDTSHCSSATAPACAAAVSAVALPGDSGPSGIVFDAKSQTVYVAGAGSGDVYMIDARSCNAGRRGGCAATPRIAARGLAAPGAIAVDTSGKWNAVYVADEGAGRVTVFGGATCNARASSGCGKRRSVTVGSTPSAIAVDPAVRTVYVANLAGDSVSTLREAACSGLQAACRHRGRAISLGSGRAPTALVADPGRHTLYVAEGGVDAVAFVNTSRCSISAHSTCPAVAQSHRGVADPTGLALLSGGRVAAAAAGDDEVVVFRSSSCNATKRTGCSTVGDTALYGSPVAIAAQGGTVFAADSTLSRLDVIRLGNSNLVSRKHVTT
jgi:DNA-binding beta-propeller fold protein YncE